MRAAQRSDVHNPALNPAQMFESLARRQKRAARVGFKHSVPLFNADLIQTARLKDGCVVHQQIDPAEVLGCRSDRLAH